MSGRASVRVPAWVWLANLAIGVLFGMTLIQSEVASWYRIQEMFRFHSFHLYGVIGSAVATAWLLSVLLRRRGLALSGAAIEPVTKRWGAGATHRYWLGGLLFGVGWGLAGSCPGPIYALIGYGVDGAWVVLFFALVGTRVYASLREYLPH